MVSVNDDNHGTKESANDDLFFDDIISYVSLTLNLINHERKFQRLSSLLILMASSRILLFFF